jgi:uncharacterized protein
MRPTPPFSICPDGLDIFVRATPNAAMDRVDGIKQLADGRQVVALRVRAVPEKGKANKAVIGLLAKNLEIPKSDIRITSGDTARIKTVHLTGNPHDLAARIDNLPKIAN